MRHVHRPVHDGYPVMVRQPCNCVSLFSVVSKDLRRAVEELKQETTKIKQFNQEILLTLADHGLGLIALNEDGEWRRLVSGKANNITVQPFTSNTQGEVLPPSEQQ